MPESLVPLSPQAATEQLSRELQSLTTSSLGLPSLQGVLRTRHREPHHPDVRPVRHLARGVPRVLPDLPDRGADDAGRTRGKCPRRPGRAQTCWARGRVAPRALDAPVGPAHGSVGKTQCTVAPTGQIKRKIDLRGPGQRYF